MLRGGAVTIIGGCVGFVCTGCPFIIIETYVRQSGIIEQQSLAIRNMDVVDCY